MYPTKAVTTTMDVNPLALFISNITMSLLALMADQIGFHNGNKKKIRVVNPTCRRLATYIINYAVLASHLWPIELNRDFIPNPNPDSSVRYLPTQRGLISRDISGKTRYWQHFPDLT